MVAVIVSILSAVLCLDCDDSRDTVRCGTFSDNVTSQCVDVTAWCNGVVDCADASDETLCNTGFD